VEVLGLGDNDFILSKEFRDFITTNKEPWGCSWVPCPRCGSSRVSFKAKSTGIVFILKCFFWVIFIIVTGFLLGLLLYYWHFNNNPIITRDFLCRDCRLLWNKEDMIF
jgi:hypothetical protein